MDIKKFYADPNEKPLDRLVEDGGFCRIFRTIGCIGDSLSSGEFESQNENGERGFHDMYEYSWGQQLARMTGCRAINFSRGGMSAKWFLESFGDECGCWREENVCQAYIIALGVNDQKVYATGCVDDIDAEHPENSKDTLAGYIGRILLRLKAMQPKAKFFLVARPKEQTNPERAALITAHGILMRAIAERFDNVYVIDLERYAPCYDDEFRRNFFLGGHMNPAGYLLTARMIASYIDYIVRNHPRDFAQIGFIGTDLYNVDYQ